MSDDLVPASNEANPVRTLDNVEYNVIDGPSDTSPLVLVERDSWLQALRIDQIVSGLDRTSDLLHVAACGVAGYTHPKTKESLAAKVASLQINLRTATGEMSSALGRFGESARKVGGLLIDSFQELYDLHEDDAIEVLADCEAIATGMTEESEKLQRRFEGVATEAAGVLMDTLSTRDVSLLEKNQAEERQRVADERHQRMLTLSEQLALQIPKVEARYEEAKAAQATADTRVFVLGITSSIMQGIGSGISAGLQLKMAPAHAGMQLATALAQTRVEAPPKKSDTPPAVGTPKADAWAKAQRLLEVAREASDGAIKAERKALEAYESAGRDHAAASAAFAAALETEARDIEKKEEANKLAEGRLKEKKKELKAAKAAAADAATDLEAAERKEAAAKTEADKEDQSGTASAIAGGMAQGLDKTGEGIGRAADSYAEIAANYAKEKAEYLRMLMDLQKEQRDALSEIKELAKKMQNEGVTVELKQAAVDSLHKAVGALREIVVIVGDVKLFWDQMAINCRRLAEDDVRKKVERTMKRPEKERIKAYSDGRFQMRLLQLSAKWSALRLIVMEYKAAVLKTNGRMNEAISQNPSIEVARTIVNSLSKQLVKKIDGEVASLDAQKSDIAAAIQEVESLKLAA